MVYVMWAKRIQIGLPILISVLALSCGEKRALEHIVVTAPENFTGKIMITACIREAAAENIAIDSSSHGQTSICAATSDLTLVVVRGTNSIEIPAYFVSAT